MKNNIFSQLGDAVGDLVHDKQRAYGDSFGRSGECLRQMFPEGINTDQYDDLLTIARILDKLFRLANDPSAFDENPYRDIVGYALLGMNRHMGSDTAVSADPPKTSKDNDLDTLPDLHLT